MLREQGKHKGGRPTQNRSQDVTSLPKLKDLGVTKKQSSRWQEIASIPQDRFEGHIEKVKDSGEELTSIGVRRFARKLGQEKFIRKFDEKIEYAKEHPEKVPVGKVYYDKSKAGYDIRFQVVGEYCGLPMIKWDCLDPEYIKLKRNETPFEIHYPIDQAIAKLEMAVFALRGVYKRYGSKIKTAYEVSCNEGKKCLYQRLVKAYGELNRIMEKIDQEDGECIEVKRPKPSSWIEGVRPGWTTWGAENPLRDIEEEARRESEELG